MQQLQMNKTVFSETISLRVKLILKWASIFMEKSE